MYVTTVTISSKGQIVLPKKIRNTLNTNIISLIINEQNQVVITPVHELGASLASYSKDPELPFEEIRERAWKNAASTRADNFLDKE
ncbi:MAG: AbrB/MazE/SpoVT family DNA-binding domain-containing protein [Chitinophagaceae bacterium]|jgi:AbrB family looped-hinge helix DNA binding protein|nr:AbrB/MazE/SpoVT family DNA-binding domain-containing protein [Chitinophagaceae bacterium]